MTQIYVVTGASRGIGLVYVKQLSSQEGNVVYAGARNPEGSNGLMALVDNKKVFSFTIDVNSRESIEKAVAKVAETATEGIDVLISNAGISSDFNKTTLTAKLFMIMSLTKVHININGVFIVEVTFIIVLQTDVPELSRKLPSTNVWAERSREPSLIGLLNLKHDRCIFGMSRIVAKGIIPFNVSTSDSDVFELVSSK
ncbi:hypothetical protein K501DRAFT_278046 [Backusella circina FSU 941]|nr:hypothetical protein K501DRAFT_278046 [Backusella circina FSU 941]